MALTSRLEVEIDSRDSEQKAKDLREALAELEASGNLINPSLKKASQGMDGLGKSAKAATTSVKEQGDEVGDLLGRIDPLIRKLNELDRQEQELAKHRKSGKIDTDTYNEYQSKIASTRAELTRFDDSMGRTGNTAKQTSAALRGVDAQVTDIFTSLQGGQAPLTVFLQQGGQLKDMFGGVGPAASALSGYILGLVNPFTVAAVAAGALGLAYYQGSKEADAYRNTLIDTGNSAGTTADALASLAGSIGSSVGTTGDAADALAQLAENGKIARVSFEAIATAAVASQEATGKAVSETVAEFAKIAEDPVKAAKSLNDQYNFLTAAVYSQIVALKERSTQVIANLGSIERGWAAIKLETRKTIDAVLNVGRIEDTAKKITDLSQKVAAAKSALLADPDDKDNQKKLTNSQLELDFLVKQRDTQAAIAAAEGLSAENQRKGIAATAEFNAQLKSGANNAEKRADAIKELNKQIAAASKADAPLADEDIARRIADINEQFKDPAVKKELQYREDAGTKMLDQARQQYAVLQQQNAQISTQAVGTKTLGTEAKKLIELEQMLADIKGKQTLTADQKSILAKADQLVGQQKINAELEKQTALLKVAGEEARKLSAFQENLNSQLELAQEGLSNQLAGAGMGSKARQRILEDLKIRQDYQKQLNALTKSYNESTRDEFSQDRYDKETAALRSALDKRLGMQQDYYSELDRAQADWTNGANAALQDYIDETNNIAGQTYGLFSDSLHGVEDAFVDAAVTGKLSFKDLADSIIADLARIVTKAYLVTPVLAALGIGGDSATGSGGGIASALSSITGGGSGGGLNLESAWNSVSGAYSVATSGFGSAVSAGWAGGQGLIGGIQGAFSSGASYVSSAISGAFSSGAAAATGAASNVGYGLGSQLVSGGVGSSGAAAGAGATYASAAANGLSATSAITFGIGGAIAGYLKAGVKGAVAGAGGAVAGAYAGAAVGSAVPVIGTAIGAAVGAVLGGMFGSSLFGGDWVTKDQGIQLGVSGGELDASSFEYQKKKGGLFSSNKKRTRLSALDPEMQTALDTTYANTLGTVIGLFDSLNVELGDGVLDGLNIADTKISTKDKTAEQVQQEVTDWFSALGNAAVTAISDATNSGLGSYSVDELGTFVGNLFSINDTFKLLNVNALPVSVWGGKLAEQFVAMSGGMEAFNNNAKSYYSNFFTETEQADDVLKSVTDQFAALGVALPASRDGFRALVEGIDSTTDAGRAMYINLIGLNQNAASAYTILEQRSDAAAAAVQAMSEKLIGVAGSAQSALQRAISAQQKATTEAYNARVTSLNDMVSTATENVSGLTSVGNDLGAALKALRGDSDDAVKMLRAQAQATLQSALATARSGGSLSGFTGLSDALDTVSSNNTDLYGSMEDFARDQGRTANVVAELNGINGKQLTAAEKSLKGLEDQIKQAKDSYDLQMAQYDQQLDFAQTQMDALNGIDSSIKSVVDAISAMNMAVISALAGMGGKGTTNSATTNGAYIDTIYTELLGRDADKAGKDYWLGQVSKGDITLDQLAQAIANAAKENKEKVKAGYATGGLISGPGSGTSDSIIARLSNGEYVLTADAVRTYGTGILDQMNAGQLPAFAGGGAIRLVGTSSSADVAGSSYAGSTKSAVSMAMSRNEQGVIDAINGLQNYLYMITKYSEQTASGIRRQNETEEAA
jgi:lambda family phage tail tape measure protein